MRTPLIYNNTLTTNIRKNNITLNDLEIYPIPTNGVVNFSKEFKDATYTIYTLFGIKIESAKLEGSYLNLEYLKPGIYFIKKADIEQKEFVKRIVLK